MTQLALILLTGLWLVQQELTSSFTIGIRTTWRSAYWHFIEQIWFQNTLQWSDTKSPINYQAFYVWIQFEVLKAKLQNMEIPIPLSNVALTYLKQIKCVKSCDKSVREYDKCVSTCKVKMKRNAFHIKNLIFK